MNSSGFHNEQDWDAFFRVKMESLDEGPDGRITRHLNTATSGSSSAIDRKHDTIDANGMCRWLCFMVVRICRKTKALLVAFLVRELAVIS